MTIVIIRICPKAGFYFYRISLKKPGCESTVFYVCSHIQDISIVLKAKQINYQRTKQTGLVCHLGA